MSKKMYFYKMTFKKNEVRTTIDTFDLFNRVISMHGVKNTHNAEDTISISISKDQRPITMDVLRHEKNYFFGRIGKVKPNSSMQVREYKTLSTEDVLDKSELDIKGVEICTYFIVFHDTGIIGFLYGQSAPHIKDIENIGKLYSPDLSIEVVALPHRDSIARLFKPGATLKNVEYKFAVPSPEVLGYIGVDKDTIVALEESELYELNVVVKARPRQNLTQRNSTIKKILEHFRKNTDINNVSFIASEPNEQSRRYTFMEDYLFYNVDIIESRTENKLVIPLTIDEYTNMIEDKMLHKYRKNEAYIKLASNSIKEIE